MIESRVSLALGGGAAKGLAHVGVLRGLEEDGIEVAAIAGTSMGSIVGALFARGMKAVEMEAFFTAVEWSSLARIMLRSVNGGAFSDLLTETLGSESIEDLDLPYAAVCCDLESGSEVVVRQGPLAEAVRASSAIPGILPPVVIEGRTLVDGAMVTPVPSKVAGRLADEPVLSVNVLQPPKAGQGSRVVARLIEATAPAPILAGVDGIIPRRGKAWWRRRRQFPNRLNVLMRSMHMMQYNLSVSAEGAGSAIQPDVGSFAWLDFHRAPEIMAAGHRAYREWVSGS